LSAEQQLERFGNSSAGKTKHYVPVIVLAEGMGCHGHSAIVVEGVYVIEYSAANALRWHQNTMRKFAIEQ
jgi:hypothetical protein